MDRLVLPRSSAPPASACSLEWREVYFFGDPLVLLMSELNPILGYTSFLGELRHDFVRSAGCINTVVLLQFDKVINLELARDHAAFLTPIMNVVLS